MRQVCLRNRCLPSYIYFPLQCVTLRCFVTEIRTYIQNNVNIAHQSQGMTTSSADTSHFLFLATLKIQHGENVDVFFTFLICSNLIDSMFVVSIEKNCLFFQLYYDHRTCESIMNHLSQIQKKAQNITYFLLLTQPKLDM